MNTNQVTLAHFISLFLASCSAMLLFFAVLADLFPISAISLFIGIAGLIHSALLLLKEETIYQVKKISLASFIISCLVTIISLLYFHRATAMLESFGNINLILG